MGDSGLKTYKMKLKVLTPTFIGGGEDYNINKSQYIFNSAEKKLHIIDERKLARFLGNRNLLGLYAKYVREVGNNKGRNQNTNSMNIGEWYSGISRMVKHSGNINECIKYSIDVSHIQRNQLNDVACFIKNIEGMPYIPGSSIKGSIVNAILVSHIQRNKSSYKRYWIDIKNIVNKDKVNFRDLNRISDRLIQDIIDYSITDRDNRRHNIRGMSGLSISDTSPFSGDMMKLYQRKDLLLTEKGENTLPIFRECLISPSEAEFSLTLDLYKLSKALDINDVDDINRALNDYYGILVSQKGLFRVFKNLSSLIPKQETTGGYLFLGGGTGYHTKTIMAALAPDEDELLKVVRKLIHSDRQVTLIHKNDKVISPRTIKVSDEGRSQLLNGICKIEVI